ncbi:ABC transporter ATP-binding protein [Streptomyces sp. NPDC051920]|uniref:ABC transporter ATP-binding protein n=1 Tax=Streptomyces sp. NPDC051920 TaxID=3155523 RepID=UPI00341EBC85
MTLATPDKAATVEFRGLRREFGPTVALDGLDLAVRPGELLALLGPSGCGKTTALRMLAGFEHPDSGEVLVDGRDITRVPAHRRDAGMVFQSYSLFPHLSALDNVAFGLRMRKARTAERRSRAAELLDLVGLGDKGERFPHQLSGGQQQRVALARALALRPRVLLLDEPLSALDAKVRLALREEIRRLQLELGITTLFVTHDQEEALSMADRVAVMRAGRLEQCASPAELYGRPATAFVAEFVGTMSRIPGTLGADGVDVLGRRLPVDGDAPAAGEVDVLVRPEGVRVSADASGDGRVVATAFLGAATRVTVRLGDGTEVKADLSTGEAVALVSGTAVTVSLPDRPVLVAARPD